MKKRILAGFVAGCLLWEPTFCFGGNELIQDFRLWTPVNVKFPI